MIFAYKGNTNTYTLSIEKGVLKEAKSIDEETLIIPEQVKVIEYYAFGMCSELKKIVLPETIKIINSRAFEYCDKLREINIPSSVEKLSLLAFGDECKPSKIIFEDGTYFLTPISGLNEHLLPIITDLPLPINLESYKKYFSEHPEIKRLFVYSDSHTFSPISVNEFLCVVEELCRSGAYFNSEGAQKRKTVKPRDIVAEKGHYVGMRLEYTETDYVLVGADDFDPVTRERVKIIPAGAKSFRN